MELILIYISRFSVLIPLVLLLRGKVNVGDNMLKVLGLLLFISAFSDLICYIMFKMNIPNMAIINLYFIIQFLLLSYFYGQILNNRKLVYTILFLFLVFVVINTLFFQPFTEFQSWSDGLQSIILLVYAVNYNLRLLRNPPQDESLTSFTLWINMGVMFYFGLNLYLFFITHYVFENESTEIAMISWSFHNFFNIVKNILFATGIYYAGRRVVKA